MVDPAHGILKGTGLRPQGSTAIGKNCQYWLPLKLSYSLIYLPSHDFLLGKPTPLPHTQTHLHRLRTTHTYHTHHAHIPCSTELIAKNLKLFAETSGRYDSFICIPGLYSIAKRGEGYPPVQTDNVSVLSRREEINTTSTAGLNTTKHPEHELSCVSFALNSPLRARRPLSEVHGNSL